MVEKNIRCKLMGFLLSTAMVCTSISMPALAASTAGTIETATAIGEANANVAVQALTNEKVSEAPADSSTTASATTVGTSEAVPADSAATTTSATASGAGNISASTSASVTAPTADAASAASSATPAQPSAQNPAPAPATQGVAVPGSICVNLLSVSLDEKSPGDVVVKAQPQGQVPSDDGKLYLFPWKVYNAGLVGGPIATATIVRNKILELKADIHYNSEESLLFDKFVVATKQNGLFTAVSSPKYISNPELFSTDPSPRKNAGKKGLIMDTAKIGNTKARELGVQQASFNIFLSDLLTGNGEVKFNYNGKTYGYDNVKLGAYDYVIKSLSDQGMAVTIVILNPWVAGCEYMVSPHARAGNRSKALYYMLNTEEKEAVETLEATMAFLAWRYNGKMGFGQVDNWIIGNEVNVRDMWNYAEPMSLNAYAQLFADQLRICYTAIKSTNSNAEVGFSLDQVWNENVSGTYTARATLDAINSCISAQGNFDWFLSEHPYPVPLVWSKFWEPKSNLYASKVTHDAATPYLTMENIEVLTDYMCQPAFRNTKGQVRPIMLTEVGYNSLQGEDVQSAALCYAFQRCMNNRYITNFIYNRQTDDPTECAGGLACGLTTANDTHKMAFDTFRDMDGPNAQALIEQSAAVMGITDWGAAMMAR